MASGSTTNYAFPYPIPTDSVDFTGDMEGLAVSIDTRLLNLVTGTGQVPATANQAGKYLYTDGTDAFWREIPTASLDSVVVSANSSETLDSFDSATYRSAEYIIQATQENVSKKTLMKILLIHDDSSVYTTSFGLIELGTSRIPMDISASINGTDVVLQTQIDDASTNNVQFEIVRTLIEA